MAGLIDASIIKPELANSFAAGYQQAGQARQQAELDQIKLDELKRDREAMLQLQTQLKSAGHNPDLDKVFDALIATGKPDYVLKGLEGKQKLKAQKEFAKLQGFDMGTAPEAAPVPKVAAQPGALGSGTFGVMPEVAPTNALAAPAAPTVGPTNALAAATAAPASTNALATQPNDAQIAQAQKRINDLMRFAASNPEMSGQAMAQARILQDQLELYSKRGQNEPADVMVMQRLGYPLTPAGYQAFRDAQRQERMLTPAEEAQRIRIANASRAPAQPVAPTIAQIVDPSDPTKMITVDARRYQGGGAGSPGVLGVAGKEPAAALRQNKIEEGKTQLQDELDNLRASFDKLNTMAALPSTERGALSNIASAAQSSGVGQMLGRATGTEAQVERDVINSAKQRLITSIKNATGMSAQQLNSNMELQAMLRSLSDPSLGYEASKRIIDDIETAYVKGSGMKKAQPTSASAAPAGVDAAIWNVMTPQERALWQKK